MLKNSTYIILLALISIFLLFIVFQWINYLVKNNYIISENFSNSNSNSKNSFNVDIPLNTTYSCANICGPNNRCSISGDQCSTDKDCVGCNYKNQEIPIIPNTNFGYQNNLDYSSLTSDIGTKTQLYVKNKYSKPLSYSNGVNTWRSRFNVDTQYYHEKYIGYYPDAPNYPKRYSLSGEFIDNGPLASNSYLS